MSKRSMFDALRGNSARTWWSRAGVALFAGLLVGVGGGFLGLRILRGDTPTASIPEVEEEAGQSAPRRTYSGPRADGARRRDGEATMVGSGSSSNRDSVAVVPDLLGRAEGDARRLLERAGFTLGEILFRQADERLGTVLETFPVPGERVQLPATINLILADRRRSIDSIPYSYPRDTTPPVAASARAGVDKIAIRVDSIRSSFDTISTRPDSTRSILDVSATRPDWLQ